MKITSKVSKLLLFILFLIPVQLFAQDEDASIAVLSKSLESEFRTLKSAEGRGDKRVMGQTYGAIAGLYISIAKRQSKEDAVRTASISDNKKENLAKSIEYANKSIAASEEAGDITQLRSSYKNLFTAQTMSGNLSGSLATKKKQTALNLPSRVSELAKKKIIYDAAVHADSMRKEQQLADERLKVQNQQLAQQQQQLDVTNKNLSATEREKQEANAKLQKTQTDLTIEKTNLQEKDKQLTQAELEKSLQAANIMLKDSVLKLQQNDIELKDKAIAQHRKEQIFYIIGIVGLLAFSVLIYFNLKAQKKFDVALSKEKKRSEELLLNILPQEVAEELMEKGFADAKQFYDVTVLFTDFVSFTSVAESMSPKELVGELHICFKAFDQILSKYHIEKIKTVGDAYMAVAGLPIANPNHAADVISAAIEIRDFMVQRRKDFGTATFRIRLGINSGNVVAGIVGVRKFAYDIWGDTVNIAARMEQNSEEGKINISETTYALVKDKFPCIYRGKIDAKNKGSVDMYYVS